VKKVKKRKNGLRLFPYFPFKSPVVIILSSFQFKSPLVLFFSFSLVIFIFSFFVFQSNRSWRHFFVFSPQAFPLSLWRLPKPFLMTSSAKPSWQVLLFAHQPNPRHQ